MRPSQQEAKNNYAIRFLWLLLVPFLMTSCISLPEKLYGYGNREGKIVIPRMFSSAEPFSEGLAAVKPDGMFSEFGFIDTNGNTVIEPQFGYAKSFSEGLAAAFKSVDRYWGYIDKHGNFVVQPRPEFAEVSKFSDGLACIAIKPLNNNQAEIMKLRYGFIDRSGNWVHKPTFVCPRLVMSLDELVFCEGLAPIYKDRRFGFMDKTGKTVIKPQFQKVESFSGGLAPVMVDAEEVANHISEGTFFGGKWGLIDSSGNFVMKPEFEAHERIGKGRYMMEKSEFYNSEGRNRSAPTDCKIEVFLDSNGKLSQSNYKEPDYISFPKGSDMQDEKILKDEDFHEGLVLLEPSQEDVKM